MIHPKDLSHHNMIHNYIYILQLGLGNIENSKLRLIAIESLRLLPQHYIGIFYYSK